jgi:hypothetical protein
VPLDEAGAILVGVSAHARPHGGKELSGDLGRFARFIARRDQRERDDAHSLSELAARPLPLPAGVELCWLGVAGYTLGYEGHALYIDPYVTRVPFRAMLSRRAAVADVALHQRIFGAATSTCAR